MDVPDLPAARQALVRGGEDVDAVVEPISADSSHRRQSSHQQGISLNQQATRPKLTPVQTSSSCGSKNEATLLVDAEVDNIFAQLENSDRRTPEVPAACSNVLPEDLSPSAVEDIRHRIFLTRIRAACRVEATRGVFDSPAAFETLR